MLAPVYPTVVVPLLQKVWLSICLPYHVFIVDEQDIELYCEICSNLTTEIQYYFSFWGLVLGTQGYFHPIPLLPMSLATFQTFLAPVVCCISNLQSATFSFFCRFWLVTSVLYLYCMWNIDCNGFCINCDYWLFCSMFSLCCTCFFLMVTLNGVDEWLIAAGLLCETG